MKNSLPDFESIFFSVVNTSNPNGIEVPRNSMHSLSPSKQDLRCRVHLHEML